MSQSVVLPPLSEWNDAESETPVDGQLIIGRIKLPTGELTTALLSFQGNDFCGDFVLGGRFSVYCSHWLPVKGKKASEQV